MNDPDQDGTPRFKIGETVWFLSNAGIPHQGVICQIFVRMVTEHLCSTQVTYTVRWWDGGEPSLFQPPSPQNQIFKTPLDLLENMRRQIEVEQQSDTTPK